MTYKVNMQLTERDTLELAAKAAGLGPILCYESARNCLRIGTRESYKLWRPLSDDGDALRLAVSIPGLNLQWIIAEARQAHKDHDERCAYVRRAIVNAAAASVMAKVMP